MDQINLLVIIAVITIFISLFLSLFLVTVKTEHKVSNRLFAFFLILTAIDISGNPDALFSISLNAKMFRNSVFFLQLPTFYLYIVSVCYSDFKLKPRHLAHAIPFFIANLILFPRFYTVDHVSKLRFLSNSRSMPEIQLSHILIHFQIVGYLIAVFILLRKVRRIYLENYSGANMESYTWLFQFTLALSCFYGIALFKNIFKFSEYPSISEGLKIGLLVFVLFIISWYLYKALNNPELFRNIDSRLQLVRNIILEESKKDSTDKHEQAYQKSLLQLKTYMTEEKPYLNPSVTIQDIAIALAIPVRDLSLLINHKLEQHFYDFINTYRVEHAMEILKDGTKSKVTISEILYEVGFNSKSSFNTAFKKHTGDTPTDYRKKLQNSTL